MSTIDIKICGLSTFEAIDTAIARGSSHVGFVHFDKSPRHVDIAEMAELVDYVQGRAETVIVTVDPDDDLVERFASDVRPDWLQLHGGETPERVRDVRRMAGLKVMKALPVADIEDLDRIEPYMAFADRILLDSRRPKGSNLPGGNGVSFDWRLLAALDPAIPFMLSGGLDAENVEAAVRIAQPSGLDISSGVESAPGIKDIGRLNRFFDAFARIAEPELHGESRS
ncbi:phosphoribosylanthranilate isomerase [Fulvimarina sp. 2208YS6-2-32]|uniref:N-(5'-phosphoribosyl)anthranilate isomerase n=1 Tax=Fulvimarina uroteuthidis TaxID=3098149 RepID=A0ABU5HX04_9HYPH|nr:phosphoribosylanthranilate isomerase [Fulvimarina sp. 2208YS6-2-32]MDY8107669.1 phosphoribosylanthranilate isomerase [Fulvimarina sp. 2208YS6-2-32]